MSTGFRARAAAPFGLAIATLLALAGCSDGPASARDQDAGLRISAARYNQQQHAESLVVYGDGIGIWNHARQFRLDPDDLERMLAAFDAAGFRDMPEAFGTGKKWLLRRASLRQGDVVKEVYQTIHGEQSRALETLVDELLAIAEEPAARDGISAANLSEGLNQVAQGRLAPQTLSLRVHRKPRQGQGWLLRVEEGVASLAVWTGQGYEPPHRWSLPAARLTALVETLASSGFETLPDNLYAPEYTEVEVRVLDQRKVVMARPFQGMEPTTHGEQQIRFDRIFTTFEDLEKDVANGGQQVGS